MKKLIALLLALTMVLSLAACGGSSTNEEPTTPVADGGSQDEVSSSGLIKVVAGTNLNPGTMEPYNSQGAKMAWRDSVYECLARRAYLGGELELILAKSYTQIDEVTYDIEIYDYIYDSEGNHLTASDVVYCYNYMKESGVVSKMGNLESITATGDYTVRMVLANSKLGTFEDMMMRPLVTEAAFEACGQKMTEKAVGTGHYAVTDYAEGSFVQLTKREDYWQKEDLVATPSQANADVITIQTVGSTSQLVIALQSGSIDGILYMSGSDTSYFCEPDGTPVDGYFVENYLDTNTYQLFYNMDENYPSVVHDQKVRQALFESIDITGLMAILDNRCEATADYANRIYPDYQEHWADDYFEYDPEHAKQLLEEAGYNGEVIRLAAYNDTPYKDIAEAIQGYAGAVGLNVQLYLYDQTQGTTVLKDHSLWDVYMLTTLSMDYIVNCWTYMFDANNWGGTTAFGLDDETFQTLLNAPRTVEGHTTENLDAFHYYVVEQAYARGLMAQYFYTIWQDGIVDVYRNCNAYAMPGCFTYADDYCSLTEK